MNLNVAKVEAKSQKAPITATIPGSSPSKFKQSSSRQFKSKPPQGAVIGFGEELPRMEALGSIISAVCPWEAYNHLELHELAQRGII
uniref:3',5'-cyclic-GMP phosphodiesterase n=1 Tax=Mola mola TaxID=94237 RepID=A0A3Q4B8T5_MOLML